MSDGFRFVSAVTDGVVTTHAVVFYHLVSFTVRDTDQITQCSYISLVYLRPDTTAV